MIAKRPRKSKPARESKPRTPEPTPVTEEPGTEPTPIITPEMLEPFEPPSDERKAEDVTETDVAPDRMDEDFPEERTADADVCSLPDESTTEASDLS
jgi:hypothetical protein